MNSPTCKVCDSGTMRLTKKYRMNAVVVIIGYILLIPSLLGMAGSGVTCIAAGAGASSASETLSDSTATSLSEAGVPGHVISEFESSGTVSESTLSSLPTEQADSVRMLLDVELAGQVGAAAGAGIMGLFSAFGFVMALVGGLLGWLLTMRKKVLQCQQCSAVVAAS